MESHPDLRHCGDCDRLLLFEMFRSRKTVCRWCEWQDPEKRAKARYSDKLKGAKGRETKYPDDRMITRDEFIHWYVSECQRGDCCFYCGVTYREIALLCIKRAGGYYAGWDIDRIDPQHDYVPGNLVLSCFVCNMAKGDVLNVQETKLIGTAVRQMWDGRLKSLSSRQKP